jgi:hypothetical protein
MSANNSALSSRPEGGFLISSARNNRFSGWEFERNSRRPAKNGDDARYNLKALEALLA